jgi:vesicle transport protein SEC22
MSIESGPYVFSYSMEDGIVYLVLTDKSYPKRLAFSYLSDVAAGMRDELVAEYGDNWRPSLDTLGKPFAFLRVDARVIQRLKKEYADPSSRANGTAGKLADELNEVQGIMRRNIQEVLERGEKLDHVSKISSRLVSESKRFKWGAKRLNTLDYYKKMAPYIIAILVVMLVLYWRFWM